MGAPRTRTKSPGRRYGSFPTTADVGLWARGRTVAELFESLGIGFFALMTDLRKVRPNNSMALSAKGSDPSSLVVSYLTELLFLQQTEGFLARRIRVRLLGSPPTALLASVQGERFDSRRHSQRKEVKAVTWHNLEVDLRAKSVRVIVDI